MGRDAIVAGTGFSNSDGSDRAAAIRKYCKAGKAIRLIREPENKYDKDAIAVYVEAPRLFGLLGTGQCQIGYIKATAADSLANKMDSGLKISGVIKSVYAPEGKEHPRVSLRLEYG